MTLYEIGSHRAVNSEELRKQYNSESSPLRKQQLRMLDILKYVDNLCRENGLNYWLSDGTLLGAVRHQGFIPWDDDVDISMPKDDLEKLKIIMKSEKNADFVFQDSSTDEYYYSPYSKIRDKKTILSPSSNVKIEDSLWVYKGLWIDIFPFEDCHPIFNRIAFYTNTWGRRFYSSTPNVLAQKLGKFRLFINSKGIIPLLRWVNKIICKNGRLTMAMGLDWAHSFQQSDIFPLKETNFEGYSFFCPNNTEGVLRYVFGDDFMSIPPINERGSHHLKVTWL